MISAGQKVNKLMQDFLSAPGDVEERLEVLRLRERFDADPQGFLLQYAEREAALAVRIREAQRLVAQVRIPRLLLKRMAELAAEAHCAGHRGELALERTDSIPLKKPMLL